MFRNSHNWSALYRALWVFRNPLGFFVSVLRRRAPDRVRVRTPSGTVTLRLRNFESLKTVFSVFCRLDYHCESGKPFMFLDVGANVGISAAYFLSRNGLNTVCCYEPDPANLKFLRDNLRAFGARASIRPRAVGTAAGSVTLYCSEDGKYSSTLEQQHSAAVHEVECESFDAVIGELRSGAWPVIVKLDVEGIERELIGHVDFHAHPHVVRLFSESTDCGELIQRSHVRAVRNGYIEDLRFLPGLPC